MISSPVDAIRLAISRGDYALALQLWNAHAADLRDSLQRGELTSGQMSETRDLFDWSALVLQGARALLQAQWNQASNAAAYLQRDATATLLRKIL